LSPSADESWDIYEGLHPDMRELIPDDVFISLLAHQLGRKARFPRVLDLLKVGRRCNMNTRAFSVTTLEIIIASLLRRLEPKKYDDKCAAVLDWLWPAYVELNGNSFAGMSFNIRRRWLSYMALRHKNDCETVYAALEDVVEQGGASGMAPTCSLVVLMYRGNDPYLHRTSLRLATWCLARDIEIGEGDLRTLLSRLGATLDKRGERGVDGVSSAVNGLIHELVAGEAHDPAQQLRVVLDWFLASQRSAAQKAEDLATDPTATMPKVHRAAEQLLKRKELNDADLAAVVNLCLRALKFNDADYEALLRITTKRLSQRETSPTHIVRLAEGIIASGLLTTDVLSPQLVSRIFNAVADAVGQDDGSAYTLAFRIYPVARATTGEGSQFEWQQTSIDRWLGLFKRAIASEHFHFASRLYADLQADGLKVPQPAQLLFIRKIASMQSASRHILLDRHVKDYLWDPEAPKEPLFLALSSGLSNSPDDAAMAIKLCDRIQPNAALPPAAIASLVTPLLTSARESFRKKGVALLARLPDSEDARPAYHAALAALRRDVSHNGTETLLQVYGLMAQRGIAPTGETASLIIGAFITADDLEVAKVVFDAATAAQHALHPAEVSRLMIKLAQNDRTTEAYAVESAWRSLSSSPEGAVQDSNNDNSIGMIFGARLFADIKQGREVDLGVFVNSAGQLVEHAGWNPSRPFFRWLETELFEHRKERGGGTEFVSLLSPAPANSPERKTAAAAASPAPENATTTTTDTETETETQAEAEGGAHAAPLAQAEVAVAGTASAGPDSGEPGVAGAKQPVRPVTQSFNEAAYGRGGRWSVDGQDGGRGGVDMGGSVGMASLV
jgi:hypothetical protein